MKMQPTQNAINLIKKYEDCKLTCYLDDDNIPTLGWGHTAGLTRDDVDVKTITQEEADDLLSDDIAEACRQLNAHVDGIELNQNQFDALTSFVFNEGIGRFASSTLLKDLQARQYDAAGAQFSRWVFGDGVKLGGLVKRRNEEAELFDA